MISRSSVATNTPANVNTRNGSDRVRENNQATIANAPGKKYGTKPKWRPTRKYLVLITSIRTISDGTSESCAPRSSVPTLVSNRSQVDEGVSNGKPLVELKIFRSPPW